MPAERLGFAFETSLAAPASRVWDHAASMQGVNRELWPLARMTFPPSSARLDTQGTPTGRRLFRSWILALGFLPVEFDDLVLVELVPGRRFLERSSMLTQRTWQHERRVEPRGDGCVVTDVVEFEPRWQWAGRLQLPLFRLVFAHRHRRLVRLFNR